MITYQQLDEIGAVLYSSWINTVTGGRIMIINRIFDITTGECEMLKLVEFNTEKSTEIRASDFIRFTQNNTLQKFKK